MAGRTRVHGGLRCAGGWQAGRHFFWCGGGGPLGVPVPSLGGAAATATIDSKVTRMTATGPTPSDTERRDALAESIFGATIGTLELMHVYVGDRLGLYAKLAEVD